MPQIIFNDKEKAVLLDLINTTVISRYTPGSPMDIKFPEEANSIAGELYTLHYRQAGYGSDAHKFLAKHAVKLLREQGKDLGYFLEQAITNDHVLLKDATVHDEQRFSIQDKATANYLYFLGYEGSMKIQNGYEDNGYADIPTNSVLGSEIYKLLLKSAQNKGEQAQKVGDEIKKAA